MNWTETYRQLNPTAQELYKRYASYRDKNMWKEQVITGGGDSDIDTKQWKAGSGANAFYLSPTEYERYDEWYKQEQAWKKEQEETNKNKKEEKKTTTKTQETPARRTVAPMPQYDPPAANFQYNPTTPVAYPTRPSGGVVPPPPAAGFSFSQPSVYTPQSAVPSNVAHAPLMSISGADINAQVNNLLTQLAGLLSQPK
jgi:hypothetical protein